MNFLEKQRITGEITETMKGQTFTQVKELFSTCDFKMLAKYEVTEGYAGIITETLRYDFGKGIEATVLLYSKEVKSV